MREESGGLAAIADEVAERVQSASRKLREENLDSLVQSATDMARRQPGIFFGVSVATGFALARFLKASASRHRNASSAGPPAATESEVYQAFGAERAAPEQA
jgi:hypothetical protein